jgi:hypothetical protein
MVVDGTDVLGGRGERRIGRGDQGLVDDGGDLPPGNAFCRPCNSEYLIMPWVCAPRTSNG